MINFRVVQAFAGLYTGATFETVSIYLFNSCRPYVLILHQTRRFLVYLSIFSSFKTA